MSDLPASILVKRQKKSFSKEIDYHGKEARITVDIRYDDECNNGHNTFSITGYIESIGGKTTHECGCIHEKIKKHFPEFKHLIKWHLTSSDGPMHYVANAIYFASDKEIELDKARHAALWSEATLDDFTKEKLEARLPALMKEFKETIESLGFTY